MGAILACLLLFLPQTGPTQKGPPIRIGATISLSGKYVELAAMGLDAMRLWEKQVNQGGGLLGRPVQLVLYDDQSQAELARKFYHQLVFEDKVDLVLAPYGTPLTLAALEVTEPQKLVMVTGSASGDTIWQRGYRYIFGIHSPGGRYLIGFLDVMARQGLESVAILYENTAFNIAVAQGGRDWSQRLGLKISYFQAFFNGKKEFPRLLPGCLATRPDGLILCSYPEDSYALLALLKQAKFRPKAICEIIAPGLPGFQQRVGNNMAEGIFGPSLWEPDVRIPFPGTKEFIVNFKEQAHRTPSYHAASAYAACRILEKGIRHNQSLDQEKLRDYILSLDTVTIVGRFRVDSTGMQVGQNPLLIQWQDGKKEIVYPISLQTAPPRF
ncbi:MAG: amino acid ABC transporter substrate-binding protein [Thermodesulfobacteriota bacterium]